MRLVLDTNEFIGALDVIKNPSSKLLLDKLLDSFPQHTISIPRTIVNEVRRNVSSAIFTQFLTAIRPIATIDEDCLVPFEVGAKYESLGLKPADAFIAAYCEWTEANFLVTENRHFLTRSNFLPFKVITAHACLKLFDK